MFKSVAILLAGVSAAGKSTLGRKLHLALGPDVLLLSTSSMLKTLLKPEMHPDTAEGWFDLGRKLDNRCPEWVFLGCMDTTTVVDCIRSDSQELAFDQRYARLLRINVECSVGELQRRHKSRGTQPPGYHPFHFPRPDFVWRSDRVPATHAVSMIKDLIVSKGEL